MAGKKIAAIGPGVLALVCALPGDNQESTLALAGKIANLRIFSDEKGQMNKSLLEVGGECLLVSQFTLAADVSRGRRPYFGAAAAPEQARQLCSDLAAELRRLKVPTREGEFAANMQVALVNDGPVTLMLNTAAGKSAALVE